MQYFIWFLIGWYAVASLATIATVGKPKKPTDSATAAAIVLINAAIIVGLVFTLLELRR